LHLKKAICHNFFKLKTLLFNRNEEQNKKLRYLLVGGFNTAFGYLASVVIYYTMQSYLHIILIGVIANIVCITLSFIMYKLFVFNSRNSWLREYLRCYVVSGGSALIGIFGLWLLVNVLDIQFWIAQGVLMVISMVISYVAHDRFTFKKAHSQ
jgi:putative flippase GtrA